MATVDILRNNIINKLFKISNEDYLSALYKTLESEITEDRIKLTDEQILMLQMAEEDVKEGRVISNEDLYKQDMEWLRGK